MRVPLLLAVLLISSLGVGAQETRPAPPMQTTLYLHADGFQDMGLSTQAPPEEFAATHGVGTLTHSTSCILGPPVPGILAGTHHTWYAVPGPVDYPDGTPNLRARGLAFPLELDGDAAPALVWHMKANPSVRSPVLPETPVLVPDVVLRATLREGHEVSVDHRALDTGRLLAQGTTEPALLSPALDGHPQVAYDEAAQVYTFRLDLPWASNDTAVSADAAFNLRVDLYVEAPTCDTPDEAYLMPDALAVHTSADFRPTLDLGVRNPLWVERLEPVVVDGRVDLHARVASPWGAYDTEAPLLEAGVGVGAGDAIALRGPDLLEPTLWTWNLTADPDAHMVRVSTTSVQGATADATALFELGEGRVVACNGTGADACKERLLAAPAEQDAPGPALLLVLLAIAAGVALATRRV